MVTPATELLDGERVVWTGTDYPPNEQVILFQCHGTAETVVELQNCDSSSAERSTTGADGFFAADSRPRRYIATSTGEHDCATIEPPFFCALVAATFGDTTQVAVAELRFDQGGSGAPAPTITVTPHTNLVEGSEIQVSGRGFQVGETVYLAPCIASEFIVSDASRCIAANGAHSAVADAAGRVEVTLIATPSQVACEANVNSCQLIAFARRNARPVVMSFDAAEYPAIPDYLGLDEPLAVGGAVDLALPQLGARQGERFEARICRSNIALDTPELCGPPLAGIVGADGVAFTLPLSDEACVGFPGTCEVRIQTPTYLFPRLGLLLGSSGAT